MGYDERQEGILKIYVVGFLMVRIACGQEANNASFDHASLEKNFLKDFYPAPIALSGADTALWFGLDQIEGSKDDFTERLAGQFDRRIIQHSITFAWRMAFREDDRIKPPREGTRGSFRRALLNSVSFENSAGHRSWAWPRMASVASMAIMDSTWHPCLRRKTDLTHAIGSKLLDELIDSFYAEFAERRVERLKRKVIAKLNR